MVTALPASTTTPRAGDLRAGQRLACRLLVQACERSLFELRCSLGEARDPAQVRTGLQAVEVLEEVLAGWREAAAALDGLQA